MTFPSYIAKSRHGIYYLRIVTPRAVQQAHPRLPKDIRRSLHTRCAREAVVRARHMAIDWQLLLADVAKMTKMTKMTNKDTDNDMSSLILDFAGGQITRMQPEPDKGDTPNSIKEYIEMLYATGVLTHKSTVLDEIAHSNPTQTQINEVKLEVLDVKAGGAWLFEIIDAIAVEKLQTKEWQENTWLRSFKPILRDFREIISSQKRTYTDKQGITHTIWDIKAREIEDEHISKFCEAMWKYPLNYGSMKNHGDAKQALNSGLPPQDKSNAFKKIRMVKTFLIWAYSKNKLLSQLDNLLPTEKRDKKRDTSKDGYQPFTPNELKLIFETPTYPDKPGWKYWTPLLAAYAGGRANEIAQLLVSDIITVRNIPCISITDLEDEDEDEPFEVPSEHIKSVKTASSRRWVPIHPKLIELGFLKYIEDLKESGITKLFELPYVKESGYGRKVSRNFSERTKKLGIYVKRKKVFHSFRSNLNGTLMRLGMPTESREFVMGHKNDSTNVGSYGKQLTDRPYELMYEWLCKVDYDIKPKTWEPVVELPAL